MARILFPDLGLGEHADRTLGRPEIAMAMGGLSTAVYNHSSLVKRDWDLAVIGVRAPAEGLLV